MDTEHYPYMVSIYIPPQLQSLLGNAYWTEFARCRTEYRAKEVARCLSLRHALIQVSQWQGDRFVPVMWLPDEATVKRETT